MDSPIVGIGWTLFSNGSNLMLVSRYQDFRKNFFLLYF